MYCGCRFERDTQTEILEFQYHFEHESNDKSLYSNTTLSDDSSASY